MRKLAKKTADFLYNDIKKRNKAIPFLILFSFLLSFLIARLIVLIFPGRSFFYKDYHIHHYFFGIILIAITGWIALVENNTRLKNILALIFGAGIGMIIDEWGLLLTCGSAMGCDYFARSSYDAVIIVSSLILLTIYFKPFYDAFRAPIKKIIKLITKK